MERAPNFSSAKNGINPNLASPYSLASRSDFALRYADGGCCATAKATKKKKEATLSEPIKQPTQGVAQTNVNETNNLNERDQKQIVDAILDKLKQINN